MFPELRVTVFSFILYDGEWGGLGSSTEELFPEGGNMKATEQTQEMRMIEYEINNSNQDLKKHL